MPVVYPQQGPGFPQQPGNAAANPALDALRKLGSLSATNSGSTGPLNSHRLTENGNWGVSNTPATNPPSATPPAAVPGHQHILNSLKMAGKPFGQGAVPALKEKPAPNTAG